MRKYYLQFRGFWRDRNRAQVPMAPGVYCVYAGKYEVDHGEFDLTRLIYIGESLSVSDQITDPELRTEWEKQVEEGEELCFSYAPILMGRKQAHATMVFRHKPPSNWENKYTFPYEPTEIMATGKTDFLLSSIKAPDHTEAAPSAGFGDHWLEESNAA